MSNIYVGQTALRIQVTCSQDITDAATLEIKYRKPDGTEGAWTGEEGVAATGVIYYDIADATILDQPGIWTFWAYIKFSDDKIGYGDAIEQEVNAEGTL